MLYTCKQISFGRIKRYDCKSNYATRPAHTEGSFVLGNTRQRPKVRRCAMVLNANNDAPNYLPACRERLLKDPDKICERLNVVDKHMISYDQRHQSVLLPSGYEFLQPLATAFVRDLGGFAYFVLDLRDSFDRRSRHFVDIQKIYRRVNGRHVQQARRERMARAITKAEELYGPVPYPKRIQWMTDVEHGWAQRRIAFLAAIRKRSGEQHLAAEDRVEALLEFWDVIDTEIFHGRLPEWN